MLVRVKQFMEPFFRMFGRVIVKLASYDAERLRMHVAGPRVQGPGHRVKLGEGVVLQNAYLNTVCGCITFGDYSFCGVNCMFLTGTHDYRLTGAARQTHPDAGFDIVIGRGVWIGSGAIILGGIRIADDAVIGAGAVVTCDCEEAGVYVGVPARMLRKIELGQ